MRFNDNSRISDHRLCNRYFYWRHRRHLRKDTKNFKADYGSAWSCAMDTVWQAVDKLNLPDDQLIELGFDSFRTKWHDELGYPLCNDMTEDEVSFFSFYHEQTAGEMLYEYIPRRRKFIEHVELVATEWPFAVAIAPDSDQYVTGKIDKVIRWDGYIWGLDHKTTSWYRKSGGFAPQWLDSWHMKSQPDQYLHALKMDFGSQAQGILIDAALVHKSVREFALMPIDKDIGMVEDWYWRTLHELTLIDANDRNLATARALTEAGYELDHLPAFPKNDHACIQFMQLCPYFDLCTSMANPEKEPDRVPAGFVEERWQPFDEDKIREMVLAKEHSDDA